MTYSKLIIKKIRCTSERLDAILWCLCWISVPFYPQNKSYWFLFLAVRNRRPACQNKPISAIAKRGLNTIFFLWTGGSRAFTWFKPKHSVFLVDIIITFDAKPRCFIFKMLNNFDFAWTKLSLTSFLKMIIFSSMKELASRWSVIQCEILENKWMLFAITSFDIQTLTSRPNCTTLAVNQIVLRWSFP